MRVVHPFGMDPGDGDPGDVDQVGSPPAGLGGDLVSLGRLFGEIGDLKRITSAQSGGRSLATKAFARAWRRLLRGHALEQVAMTEAASACAGARLGPLDPAALVEAGLDRDAVRTTLGAALSAVGSALPAAARAKLAAALADLDEAAWVEPAVDLPRAIALLAAQPRAGATRPGHPRLMLEPSENHADHCYLTAVIGALLALADDSDPGPPFLLGLAHHLHNAYLPDAGFTGEMLLGPHLLPVVERLTERALAELPPALAQKIRAVRRDLGAVDTPLGRSFNAADVLDRVLQMAHYARAASFELKTALDDLDLVHPGPLLAFQEDVLASTGLRPC